MKSENQNVTQLVWNDLVTGSIPDTIVFFSPQISDPKFACDSQLRKQSYVYK